jgi:murein DD-endopeptidase MepM/ murein hydrolase activator NlpD
MKSLSVLIFVVLFAPTFAQAQALTDTTSVLKKAREYTPFVSSNTAGPLWAAFDANMRAAMQDSLNFAKTLDAIYVTVGAIKKTLSEEVTQERGVWVYRAVCEFDKVSDRAELLMAFDPDGKIAGLAVRPQPKEFASTKLDYVNRTSLQLPFQGEWYVFWGGRTIKQNYHAVAKAQRFACDFVMMKNAVSHTDDGKKLTDYYCYGAEIIAPAAGQIVWSCDSLPNQEPGEMDAKHPVGNGVVIDHGNGEFSLIAHLQPKTQRFKVGDKVNAGDVLGKCGNSGNTSEPHVHYHLQDGPDIMTAEGLPASFTGICVNGKKMEKAEPVKGQTIKRCP